jgi:hypothetical protein
MHDPVSTPIPAATPWRLLILDPDRDDPLWIVATVTIASDVLPAAVDPDGHCLDWEQAAEWVRAQVGQDVGLSPIAGALCWRVEPGSGS